MAGSLLATSLSSRKLFAEDDPDAPFFPVSSPDISSMPEPEHRQVTAEKKLGLQYVETPLTPVAVPPLPHKLPAEASTHGKHKAEPAEPLKSSYQITYSAMFGSSVLAILIVTSERYRIARWQANSLSLLTVANLIAGFAYSQIDENLFEKRTDPLGARYTNWVLTTPLVLSAVCIAASNLGSLSSESTSTTANLTAVIALSEIWVWLRYLYERTRNAAYAVAALVVLAVLVYELWGAVDSNSAASKTLVAAVSALLVLYSFAALLPFVLKNVAYNVLDLVLYVGLIVAVGFYSAVFAPFDAGKIRGAQ